MRILSIVSLTLLFPVTLFFSGLASAAVIHVPADYATIQEAIDAAAANDEVVVAPGTYEENIDFLGKAICVRSSDGPEVTVIDAGNPAVPALASAVRFVTNEGRQSILDGFTLTKGTGTEYEIYPNTFWFLGGGCFCLESTPVIRNNILIDNEAETAGGGIACIKASPLIENNYITQNVCSSAGIYCRDTCNPTIEGNTIIRNEGSGIRVYSNCNPVIENNVITENSTTGYGGGMYCSESTVSIRYNFISHNYTEYLGGGMFIKECAGFIESNHIAWNTSYYSGGGISLEAYDGDPHPRVAGNYIHGNGCMAGNAYGGGIRCYKCNAEFINNTIVGNSASYGGGLYIRSTSQVIVNTILWENHASVGPQLYLSGQSDALCEPTISHSALDGGMYGVHLGYWSDLHVGDGMVYDDPLFVNLQGEDYHLTYPSPCRDAGDPTVTEIPPMDFEGDPRIAGTQVDIGADEFYTRLYCNGDFRPWGYVELKIIDVPGSGPVFLWGGVGLLEKPINTAYGNWYLETPLVLDVNLGAIPADGCYYLFALIPPDIVAPAQMPIQAFTGNRLTNYFELKIEPL